MMRDLKGYEGLYKINECGVIINKKGHVMRTAQSNVDGRLRVSLIDPVRLDPKRKNNEFVSRLVAKTFVENPDPENNNVVLHKDNDCLNNHYTNLKWGTQSENIKQAFEENRKTSPGKTHKGQNIYEVYNDKTGDNITCYGRTAVADLIEYKEISLKNMVGNGREIALGPYAGYKIRRNTWGRKAIKPLIFKDNFEFDSDYTND